MTMDKFTVQRDLMRRNCWRVVWHREDTGMRAITPRLFRKKETAERFAYRLEVENERRRNRRIYMGD